MGRGCGSILLGQKATRVCISDLRDFEYDAMVKSLILNRGTLQWVGASTAMATDLRERSAGVIVKAPNALADNRLPVTLDMLN